MTDNRFICRLCLSTQPRYCIFTGDCFVLDKIQSFCTIQINKNDGLPDHICSDCLKTLDIIFDFKLKCEESDKILRNKLYVGIHNIKDESEDIEQENLQHEDGLFEVQLKQEKISESKSDSSVTQDCNEHIETNFDKAISNKKSHNGKLKDKSRSSKLCPLCGKLFLNISALNSHIKNHNSEKTYKCTICSKGFINSWKLSRHHTTHTDLREYPCRTCGKKFKSKYDVNRHSEFVHDKIKVGTCKLCGKQLASKFSLKIHMKVHTGEKSFQCDICKQFITNKQSLILHMRTHTGEKPYACRFCSSKFSGLKTLVDHERIHTGETPYSCPECPKAFTQLSNMKSHFRNNHKGIEFIYKNSRSINRLK